MTFVKADRLRRIDRVIDYFGEPQRYATVRLWSEAAPVGFDAVTERLQSPWTDVRAS